MAGRPEGALEAAKRSLAAGHQAKLRSFIPALKSFCAKGDFLRAFEASLLANVLQQIQLISPINPDALLLMVCSRAVFEAGLHAPPDSRGHPVEQLRYMSSGAVLRLGLSQ